MPLDFGKIEDVALCGTEIQISGHLYVGLAFDQDRPYQVTHLCRVDRPDLDMQSVDLLRHTSDVYDSEIRQLNGRWLVEIEISGLHKVIFHCDEIIKKYRYYHVNEIEQIFKWLPSKCTTTELARYTDDLRKHGISVSILDGKVIVSSC